MEPFDDTADIVRRHSWKEPSKSQKLKACVDFADAKVRDFELLIEVLKDAGKEHWEVCDQIKALLPEIQSIRHKIFTHYLKHEYRKERDRRRRFIDSGNDG